MKKILGSDSIHHLETKSRLAGARDRNNVNKVAEESGRSFLQREKLEIRKEGVSNDHSGIKLKVLGKRSFKGWRLGGSDSRKPEHHARQAADPPKVQTAGGGT
ncbi:MAG: hypothetical protein ACSHYF_10410 [Verrucomicrobiaceae bacterium]